MKHLFYIFTLFVVFNVHAQQNGIVISSNTSATPDASAILDIQSTNQGILISRVSIVDLTKPTPITSPAVGLLVYNTNTITGEGFYYWNGSIWRNIGGSTVKEIKDLKDGETGSHSTILGTRPLGTGTINKNNTGFGYATLDFLTTGNNNIAIGYMSGGFLDAGNNNILIGENCSPSKSSASNELNIGKLIYGKNIYYTNANMGLGSRNSSPDASALLDMSSTKMGLLIPRMTKLQRDAITSPAEGLLIYQTDNTPGFYYYDVVWMTVAGAKKIDDLEDGVSSNNNVILGENAGTALTGSQNVALGFNAFNLSTNVNNSVAIGYKSLMNSAADRNTAIGDFALMASTTGADNTAIGQKTLTSNKVGSSNTAVGAQVLKDNITGSYNSAFGYQSLSLFNSSGNNNTAIGTSSLGLLNDGSNNIALGYNAGGGLSSGSNNILIGNSVSTSSSTASNEMNIADVVYANNLGSSNAKVGIGNKAPKSTLDISGSMSLPITFAVSNYTLTENDYTVVASGNMTITLPNPVNIEGRIYVIKVGNSGTVTVKSNAGAYIDTSQYIYLSSAYDFIKVQSTGGNKWLIIGKN